MNKFLVFFIVAFQIFFSGCSRQLSEENISPPSKISGEIRAKAADKLIKKYDLMLVGTSAAMPGGVINNLGLVFHIHKVLTREQAREILVGCVEELISEVNMNKEIRPYLKNYPFTPKNITITLVIYNSNGTDVFDPDIGAASASHGKIWYATVASKRSYSYKSEYKESFDEAVKLVQEAQSKQKK
jgi:hypothetical protein